MLDGSTAPHCKQVLVTGEFCAADAHTPVRSVPAQNNRTSARPEARSEEMLRKGYRYLTRSGYLSVHLLREHVATERDAALEGHGREIGALSALEVGPGTQ